MENKLRKYPFKDTAIDNVEVEKGETILIPDGELFGFFDKTHKQGGEDIHAPSVNQDGQEVGSRIYSDQIIADPEYRNSVMGRNLKKGYTYAELSKMFNPTKENDILRNKSGRYDDLSKNTAEFMKQKKVGHLENLFAAQELQKREMGIPNDLDKIGFDLESAMNKFPKGELPKAVAGSLVGDPPHSTWGTRLGSLPDNLNIVDYDFSAYDLPDKIPHQKHLVTFGTDDNIPLYGPAAYSKENLKKLYDEMANAWEIDDTDLNSPAMRRVVAEAMYAHNKGVADKWLKDDLINDKAHTKLIDDLKLVPDSRLGLAHLTYRPLALAELPQSPEVVSPTTEEVPVQQEGDLASLPTPIKPVVLEGGSDGTIEEVVAEKWNSVAENMDEEEVRGKAVRDPMMASDALAMGSGLLDMLTLSKTNPYYGFAPEKPAMRRYSPVNTLANERAFNLQKKRLESIGVPKSVQNSLLGQGQHAFHEGVNQISIHNAKYEEDLDNANVQSLWNAYNRNKAQREVANERYLAQTTQASAVFDQTMNNLKTRMKEMMDDINYRKYSRNLISLLGRNYMLDRTGMVRYIPGSTPDPRLYNPLSFYNLLQGASGEDDQLGSLKKQLQKQIDSAGSIVELQKLFGL